ncbi:hypothetical protein PCASD_01317 [Puccinia coronata f. sp. avenae]|uniref:Uncharacterized protein n=1 Tax=Puccinia coronata f. sp. avenae TaxID=200324 RepID=A0A2N5VJ09_9BASI|nr:hypothetical protein PCASD_01317 [Puccinia coronata f. sp. avenae]
MPCATVIRSERADRPDVLRDAACCGTSSAGWRGSPSTGPVVYGEPSGRVPRTLRSRGFVKLDRWQLASRFRWRPNTPRSPLKFTPGRAMAAPLEMLYRAVRRAFVNHITQPPHGEWDCKGIGKIPLHRRGPSRFYFSARC